MINNRKLEHQLKDSPESFIPPGMYCYFLDYVCPFWDISGKYDEQENGYCHYLKAGDWEPGGGLLWDQCKLCRVGDDEEECSWSDAECGRRAAALEKTGASGYSTGRFDNLHKRAERKSVGLRVKTQGTKYMHRNSLASLLRFYGAGGKTK